MDDSIMGSIGRAVASSTAGERPGHTAYRPDIDGLRAVAVLSVVLYHLKKALVPGGYVGVDIFFVISGFLITRNIWGEMCAGRFSLANFYLRRVRRIAPAFLAMTLVTLLAGCFLLLPKDLLRLAGSALAAAFSLSNVYFWRYLDTSYFAESSDQEPLLHTWSLGVEEQFYLLWPAVLLLGALIRSRKTAITTIAVAIAIASFACAEFTNVSAAKFAYYMLPARAGELMVGALLALWRYGASEADIGTARRHYLAEGLGLVGLGLIGYALFGLDDFSRFPGINAVYPSIGAALVMLAGEWRSKLVTLLLTSRAMVFIGLISYSLYLWHWPVLAFIRYFLGEVDLASGLAGSVAIALLSVASYWLVEQPARKWRARPLKQVLALYAMPSGVACAIAGAIFASGGLKSVVEHAPGYTRGLVDLDAYTAPAYKFAFNCQLSHNDPSILAASRCVIGPVESGPMVNKPGMLLWGDSRAAQYVGLLSQVAKQGAFNFRNATFSSCPPIFGEDHDSTLHRAGCDAFRATMEPAILEGQFRTVVVSASWNFYDRHSSLFREDLERTIASMVSQGIHVVILGENPFFEHYDRQCELRGLRIGGLNCQARLSEIDHGDTDTNRYLASLADRYRTVSYLDTRGLICNGNKCSPYLDGHPIYFDRSHISMSGSVALGKKLLSSPLYPRWTLLLNRQAAEPLQRGAEGDDRNDVVRGLGPMLTGVNIDFPARLRWKNPDTSGRGPSGVVLEYWGATVDHVADSLADQLKKAGFRETASRSDMAGRSTDFIKAGRPMLTIMVEGSARRKEMRAPQAEGVIYVHW